MKISLNITDRIRVQRKKLLLTLLLGALYGTHFTSLFAQPMPICSGLMDNYICPEEPVSPDPALLNLLTGQNANNPCFGLLEFDNFPGLTKCNGIDIPDNALFIHQLTFPVSGNVTSAILQFRAKAAPSSPPGAGQSNTDFIAFFEGATYITGANLIQLPEAGGTWNPNQDASFTLNLGNLPAVFSQNNILQYLNDGDLDVVIGNETGVDWMCITPSGESTCCTDSLLFYEKVAQGFTVATDPTLCKATVTAPQFDSCHWFTTPPHLQGANVPQVITDPSGMWMFNFTQSGSYTICVIVYEENANGEICWQKEMCTTVDISCTNACVCGDFTGMNWRPVQGAPNQPIMCGQELTLPCTPPGYMVNFGGNFNCIGNNCISTVNWVLREKVSQTPVISGSATGPGFQILIPESSFVYPTVYELVFTAACNGVICDSCVFTIITTECPCHCGQFDKMFMRTTKGAPSIAMQCGGDAVPVGCPLPGQPMQFTGLFQCDGPDCPDSALVSWKLVRLPSTTVATGNTKADPFFGVSIMPLWYTTPGMYELQLSGYCGFDTCTCSVKFIVNCPNACPCDPLDFIADLNRGFSTTLFETTSCFACFSPINLSDCDMVEWSVNGVPTGTTIGEAMFFYTFTTSGTYEIKMHATRFSSDGSVCHFADFTKSITITCPFELGCTGGVLPNPTFSQDATAGILGAGGTSLGWGSGGGAPVVVEGGPNTNDGWTIELSGNFDTSDVLTTLEPICLEKTIGLLTLDRGIKEQGIKSVLVIALYRGDNFDLNDCDGSVCFEIDAKAESDRPYKDRVQFPYDLSDWAASDDCGDHSGVLVRPVVYAYNHLGFNQGGNETKTVIYIDNLCLDGQLVDLQEVRGQQSIHLYPNPTSNTLTLEFKGAVPKAGSVQILDLYGRLLERQNLLPGQQKHQLSVADLPAGMYFVRVTDGGVPIWSEKVVKQ